MYYYNDKCNVKGISYRQMLGVSIPLSRVTPSHTPTHTRVYTYTPPTLHDHVPPCAAHPDSSLGL